MPHVTTHYRIIVAAGHHRQPRNQNSWIEPNPQSDADVLASSVITPYAPPQLAYVQNGKPQIATFLFWSATDGVNGQTTTNQTLTQTVGGASMTLTAWYLPPGGIGNGGPGYFVDAFSDAKGDFVDDTFVTVRDASNAANAALTNEANVVGVVDTPNLEKLDATAGVQSTGESFEHWITVAEQGQAQPVVAGQEDTLAATTSGVAIASYHKANIQLPKQSGEREGWVILGGIAVDGPGWEFPIGHPGTGGPVGPWGPYLSRILRATGVASLGSQMEHSAEIARLAFSEAEAATKQLGGQLAQGAREQQ
jgi:hypothetical protein